MNWKPGFGLTGGLGRLTLQVSLVAEELAVPQSIPADLTRQHVLKALADLDAAAQHPFGPPTKFEVVYEGKY